MNIFEFLNHMTETKEELDFSDPEISKEYDNYIINRYVSMCEIYIPMVNEINKHDIPKENNYYFYHNVLPKRKQFFSYIKKPKDLGIMEKRLVAHYFEVGIKEAEEYIKIMSEDELKELLNIFKYGKNRIIDI
jgi:hypothetical protein